MARRSITRRDFLNGVAITGAAFGLAPAEAFAKGLIAGDPKWVYPPERTGMRGSHEGSFEVAHAISWEGKVFDRPKKAVDRPYDLIVVGGGISGLTTARLARDRLGASARILILDNHDDFGGHAKRNEFLVKGKRLIGYGGSQSIDSPKSYSPAAREFIQSLGIETEKFYRYYDRSWASRRNLGTATYLDKETYGSDRLLKVREAGNWGLGWSWSTEEEKAEYAALIDSLPFPAEELAAFRRLVLDKPDWLGDMPIEARAPYLKSHSLEHCLKTHAGISDGIYSLFGRTSLGLWGIGWDAVSALEAVREGHFATEGLKLDEGTFDYGPHGEEPYIFHFPDGNAGVARMIVADLLPDALRAGSMEEGVEARAHYDRLDRAENGVRIRLRSTAVNIANTGEGAEVTYVRDGRAERVTGAKVIFAGYAHILPYILPELPAEQIEAIRWPKKVPLAYINVALTNWHAFAENGISSFFAPGKKLHQAALDFPVSIGNYRFADNPDDPIIAHLSHVPCAPGMPSRDQHVAGRHEMYAMTFEDYEAEVLSLLKGGLGSAFDAERDIAAITVNRWPHGYAYEYNELWDDPTWSPAMGPHLRARQQVGNISIAGSDASAFAYVDGAIDAAVRAVREQFGG